MIKWILLFLLLCTSAHASFLNVYNPYTGKYDKVQDITDTQPASITTTCDPVQIAYDSSYLYICVSTDSWKRVSLSTWSLTDILLLDDGTSAILLDDGTSNLLIRP